jgi:hypothetical protein
MYLYFLSFYASKNIETLDSLLEPCLDGKVCDPRQNQDLPTSLDLNGQLIDSGSVSRL